MRASDQDREATVWVLREAYVAGRLDLDELRIRAAVAWQARALEQLRALTADLPAGLGRTGTEVSERRQAAGPPVRRLPATDTSMLPAGALACLALAAATGWYGVLIPLIMLIPSILAVALCSLATRTPRGRTVRR